MKTERNIFIAFLLNLSFSVFEFIGGIITGSVAIMSDAVHDIGDAASIGISFFLEKKSKGKPDEKYTYGYARYSVVGGLITTLILLLGSVMVIYNAVNRIIEPTEIDYTGMIIFAVVGVCVNFCAAIFTREGGSLNQKAVNLHMLEDVLGWLVVLMGAIVMKFTDFALIDPILSIGVALFIFINAVKNLKEVVDLFLEKTPHDIEVAEIKEHIEEIDGVVVVKGLAGYVELGVAVEHACKACKYSGENEAEELVAGNVDTCCLGCDLVVAYRLYRTSVLASNEVLEHEESDENDNKTDDEEYFLVVSGCGKSDRTAKGLLTCVLEDRSYDLTKGECGDSQIVAAQTECGKTDEESANTCTSAAHEERDDKREHSVSKRSGEHSGDLTAKVSAYTHKSCMSERELAKEAYNKAERECEDYFYSHLLEQIYGGRFEHTDKRKYDEYHHDSAEHNVIEVALHTVELFHDYTFSFLILPSKPEGLTRRSIIKIENSIASV